MNEIVQGDCVRTMHSFSPRFANLIFADPPFNIGYKYRGYVDILSYAKYVRFTYDWIGAAILCLHPTGSFYVAIGDEYAAEVCMVCKSFGLNMRNWLIWHYGFGQQTKRKFARCHTHILYFTKDPKKFTFNADAVKIPSDRQGKYGDKRGVAAGKVPPDVWGFARLCGTFKERQGWHGCQMPIALMERIVNVSSNPGDVVLDPFLGSGTTAVAAKKLGRSYLGIEQSEEYCKLARQRLANV
jgi:DNA modification methylase